MHGFQHSPLLLILAVSVLQICLFAHLTHGFDSLDFLLNLVYIFGLLVAIILVQSLGFLNIWLHLSVKRKDEPLDLLSILGWIVSLDVLEGLLVEIGLWAVLDLVHLRNYAVSFSPQSNHFFVLIETILQLFI